MPTFSIEQFLSFKSDRDHVSWYLRQIVDAMARDDVKIADEVYDTLVNIAAESPVTIRQARATWLLSELANSHLRRGESALGSLVMIANSSEVQQSAISFISQGKHDSQIGAVMFAAAIGDPETSQCAQAALERMLDEALADA